MAILNICKHEYSVSRVTRPASEKKRQQYAELMLKQAIFPNCSPFLFVLCLDAEHCVLGHLAVTRLVQLLRAKGQCQQELNWAESEKNASKVKPCRVEKNASKS